MTDADAKSESSIEIAHMQTASAWPFEEARKLQKHLKGKIPEKGYVVFETGYGPSGLPHIGTFGEVVRTTMVMNAFRHLTNNTIPVKLICFSDDMDGFRKVPDNVPNAKDLEKYLHFPLTKVKDPFACCESFGHHNNKKLCDFLDTFNFSYEFVSATHCYTSGMFNDALLRVLQCYDTIQNIMLPTLGNERQKTYSPFLPICAKTGRVLQVPICETNVEKGTITYRRDDRTEVETPVVDGKCKLQWKVDWAMRWYALNVDYEMCGKDLKPSVDISSTIIRTLGGEPPKNLVYELFLDEYGEKISKSKGNGLSIEDWLKYAPAESLSLYMYKKPKTAKKLFFDVIPKAMDEYLTWVSKYHTQDSKDKLENPAYHIHGGVVPKDDFYTCQNTAISFNLLLNLAGAANASTAEVMWGFISRYAPGITAENNQKLNSMVQYAVQYYQDFIKPKKTYRPITTQERPHFEALKLTLQKVDASISGAELQTLVFNIGKEAGYENLRDWFKALYETLLGQSQGPRMGGFFSLYGIEESIALVEKALENRLS